MMAMYIETPLNCKTLKNVHVIRLERKREAASLTYYNTDSIILTLHIANLHNLTISHTK